MRIDLNCPAEIVESELHRGEDHVQLILMNLSDRGIDSCEATVRVLDRSGEEAARAVHRARALRGRPHATFTMSLPMELPESALRAEASLDKVWFEDHDVWRRNPAKEIEYEPNVLPPGNELNALKYVAGGAAVGFPSQQAACWICVCGRANGNEEAVCGRCRRQREMIFQQYNRNAVLRQVNQRERQLELETRGAREETARLQRLREEEYTEKKRRARRWRRGIIAAAVCLAVAAGIYYLGLPALRLWNADTALREERLEDARQILTDLEDFPGAADRLTRTELEIARRDGTLAAEDETAFSQEEMNGILARLREEDSTEEDRLLADRVVLSQAWAWLRDGEIDQAEKELDTLPADFPGAAELRQDCLFARAENAMAAKDYAAAREMYLTLGDYPGAAEKAVETLYEGALARLEAGEYDEAIADFEQIPDYLDSREMIARSWYLKGYVLENQGETENARQAYLAAGDYEDAAERALVIRWNEAEALLAAEDYEHALPLYRELDGYEDARDKWIQCATEMARAAYKQREYIMAASWLEDLPEDTKDTLQIRTRAYFLGAKAAANRGELAEAIALMEHVPTYGDAQRNIRNWRIALAQEKMDAGEYEAAKELLEPVAESYNAQKLLKEIEKLMETDE